MIEQFLQFRCEAGKTKWLGSQLPAESIQLFGSADQDAVGSVPLAREWESVRKLALPWAFCW